MRLMDESEQTMRRYLLGELSESEESALEEQYFTDPQLFEQILKTESELVDSYVRGQLSKEVRARFEQSYMTDPRRSERVKFATALATRLDRIEEFATGSEQPPLPFSWWQRLLTSLRGKRPTLRLSIAFATMVVMLGGVWVWVGVRRAQRESAQTQAANEAQQRREREQSQQVADEGRRAEESSAKQEPVERNPQQIPQPQISQPTPNPSVSSAPRSVSVALTTGGVRGADTGQIPTLIIPPEATQARLQLNLKGNDYPSYNATLQTAAGVEIFSRRGIKPGRATTGASFVFTVPTRKLASGDYVLTMRGVSPTGEVDDLSKSLFRVEKR